MAVDVVEVPPAQDGVICIGILVILYGITCFCEFLAPYDPQRYDVTICLCAAAAAAFYGQRGCALPAYVYG